VEPGPPLDGGYTESSDIGGANLRLSIKRTK
jgi:hypothetical protein